MLLLRRTHALPVDAFRVLAGLLGAAYFLSLLAQVPDFGAPDGLLDHALIREIYWYAGLGLLPPGLPAWAVGAALAAGLLACCGLAAGWRPRLCAAAALVLAVSATRRGLIVMYVDDAVTQLTLAWLVLLPTGRTLVLADWLRDPAGCRRRWPAETVPGAAPRLFLINIGLAYLVAGLWKLTSPMWREGFGLYAVLRLPLARWPDLFGPADLGWLKAANHLSVLVEVLIPGLLALPVGHPLKWLGLAGQAGFHAGIIALLKFPFANLAMLATAPLFFGGELMRRVLGRKPPALPADARLGRWEWAAAAMLVLGGMSVTRGIPGLRVLSKPAERVLFVAGVYQDFRLFNWIDRKNFRASYRLTWRPPGGAVEPIDAEGLFPDSARGAILQSYLFGEFWHWIPWTHLDRLRDGILSRAADRFCRRRPLPGRVEVRAFAQRITPENAGLAEGRERFLMEFACRGDGAFVCRSYAAGTRASRCP